MMTNLPYRTKGVTAKALRVLTARSEMAYLVPDRFGSASDQMAAHLLDEGRTCVNCKEIPSAFIVIPSPNDVSLLCRSCIRWITHLDLNLSALHDEEVSGVSIEDTVKLLVKIHTETSA